MKYALAAVGFINEDITHNKNIILKTLTEYAGKADLVLFGEAFLQGFYAANFSVPHDEKIAISINDTVIKEICLFAKNNSIAVSFGFIEKENDFFYSSQITIDKDGQIIDLYRRVSPGWKESFANDQYLEGDHFHIFDFYGQKVAIGLCGDLWFDENVAEINALNPDIVWWPVYTDFHFHEWNQSIKYEYAERAQSICQKVLYVNSFCIDKAHEHDIAKGGAAYFKDGNIEKEASAGRESILFLEC